MDFTTFPIGESFHNTSCLRCLFTQKHMKHLEAQHHSVQRKEEGWGRIGSVLPHSSQPPSLERATVCTLGSALARAAPCIVAEPAIVRGPHTSRPISPEQWWTLSDTAFPKKPPNWLGPYEWHCPGFPNQHACSPYTSDYLDSILTSWIWL